MISEIWSKVMKHANNQGDMIYSQNKTQRDTDISVTLIWPNHYHLASIRYSSDQYTTTVFWHLGIGIGSEPASSCLFYPQYTFIFVDGLGPI